VTVGTPAGPAPEPAAPVEPGVPAASAPEDGGLGRRLLALLAPLTGLVLVLLLAAITTPGFFSGGVLRLVLFHAGLIGITAVGQTLVLLIGGIDLSIGAVIGLTTVIVASYSVGEDGRLGTAVLLALAAGLGVGLLNGLLVTRRLVPAFVATFASFVLVQGVVTAWTRGAPSGTIPGALSPLGTGRWLGIPVPAWVFLLVAVVAGVVLSRTGVGRRIYATGANARATALSGVRTGGVVTGCFVASALLAVVAGLINAGYIGYVDAQLSRSLDLDSVAAAVIGGIALTGGRGRIGQTVAGVALLAVLLAWLRQLGAGAGAQLVVSGAVILLAVWLQSSGWTARSPRRTKQRDGVR
jgi:ribose transport system permease protein